MKFIKIFGSLGFALFLIGSLAAILSVSTVYESLRGTPAAQETFYRAHWFDAFLSLLFLNILCSTLTRWPFKKKHIGFVITHLGILLLLTGSLVTRLYGDEGQMTLFEDESKDRALKEGLVLRVQGPDKKERRFDMPAKPLKRPVTLGGVRVDEVLVHAVATKRIEEDAKAPKNRAVQAEISSEMIGMTQSVLLLERDPFDPASSSKRIGPATFTLETPALSARKDTALLRLYQSATNEAFETPLGDGTVPVEWPATGLTITNIHYYPHARVEDGKVVERPSADPNPAVEFEVVDASGRREHHTKFTLFPSFNSLRGGEKNDLFGLEVRLDLPGDAHADESPAFIFSVSPDGAWSYRVRSSKDPGTESKPLAVGEDIATGWMDMKLRVKRTFANAKVSRVVLPDPEKRSEMPALKIAGNWLLLGRSMALGEGPLATKVSAEAKSIPLPFSLWLKDFRKTDYPGTSTPASYESDVVLVDSTDRVSVERTISMNKPLDHKGWRIFQSSYIQDPELGEASVFSIAKNPGIPLIYSGAALIFVGVILLFYFHPFFQDMSSPRKRGSPKSDSRLRGNDKKGKTRHA